MHRSVPYANRPIKRTRNDDLLLLYGDDIKDRPLVARFIARLAEVGVPTWHEPDLFKLDKLVNVDYGVWASAVEETFFLVLLSFFDVDVPVDISETELDFRGRDSLTEVEWGHVPEEDGEVVAAGGHVVELGDVFDVEDRAFVFVKWSRNLLAISRREHPDFIAVLLQGDYIIQLWDEEQLLDFGITFEVKVRFLVIWEVLLYDVWALAFCVLFDESQLYDVVWELIPFHGFIAIYVDFLKQVDEINRNLNLLNLLFLIRFQLLQIQIQVLVHSDQEIQQL